ncbi:MAG: VPLPA-CTERM sorting domain-containing protein, partial [Gammaproteobacteria bacterium]
AGGALSLLAGEVYTFVVTNSGVVTTGYFTGFEFSTTPVPLPAALPVMLSALAGLAAVRRRS